MGGEFNHSLIGTCPGLLNSTADTELQMFCGVTSLTVTERLILWKRGSIIGGLISINAPVFLQNDQND